MAIIEFLCTVLPSALLADGLHPVVVRNVIPPENKFKGVAKELMLLSVTLTERL